MMQNERLFNRNYIIMSVASLLMFTAFNLMMPIIAMYVVDRFEADQTTAGIVAASYIITALLMRPFSGYLVDKFDRKRLYLIVLALFAAGFGGYIISTSIVQLIITRIFLGATFALVTTASSTIVIDVIPSSRRAEGIGYYGAIVVLAMAVGPMLGLYLINYFSYDTLFKIATASAWLSLLVALFVKTRHREPVAHEPMSVDRFFLREGLPIALVIMLLYFLYGTLMVYVSLYVRSCAVDINSGNFFFLFACGIIVSRIISGRYLRKGRHHQMLQVGIFTIIATAIPFIFMLNATTFPVISVLLGFGFGLVGPSVQYMIIDLVPARRRGTANSTYFIALDLGSGMGMLVGGSIAHIWGYQALYSTGVALVVIALLYYYAYARNSYDFALVKSKLG